jgi:NaMN:DMB phosphoribosyltransferase
MSSLAIQQRIDNKTKPLGALGQLESLALQLATIQGLGLSLQKQSIEISEVGGFEIGQICGAMAEPRFEHAACR